MTADEALQMIRDARNEMQKEWEGKSEDEILRELNEKGRRAMAELQPAEPFHPPAPERPI